jgi:polyisoprenoid-binding protein YceI
MNYIDMLSLETSNMMPFARFAVATCLAFCLSAPARADLATDVPAGTYKLDPTHASLTWKVLHMGLANYTARFAKLDATLVFDPAKPEAAKLTASVDPTSIKTDYPNAAKVDFDKELVEGSKFFNANVAKTITFTSTAVKMTGAKTADVTGDLTFLGVTKPVTLKATFNGGLKEHPFAKKPAIGFSGTATIKRSEFGMSHLIPIVADDVNLLLEAEFFGG